MAAFVGTSVAFILYGTIFRLANAANTWFGVLLRGAPVGLALVGGGYAVTRLAWLDKGWPEMVGAVLIVPAGMALCNFVATSLPGFWALIELRSHWRRGPREDILDELLGILDDLANPRLRNDLDWRAAWMSRLERAASAMEKRLPSSVYPADQATTSWTSERARGAATALRLLKRLIAAPVDGSWDRLTAILRYEVVALATGDLGKLRWATPPSPAMLRRSRWKTAMAALKTMALAAAPLVAVLAIQPLLHLEGETLRWAKVIGLGWAVLYVLLAADPTLREKIETAQSVSNLLGTARREIGRLDRRNPPGAGGGPAA